MAFQMNYTLNNGMVAQSSYWVLTGVQVYPAGQMGNLYFSGYASAADFAAGKPPIAQKSYSITRANYAAFLAATNLTTAVYDPAYEYAQQALDTPGVDGDGNPIMQSFFAGAAAV